MMEIYTVYVQGFDPSGGVVFEQYSNITTLEIANSMKEALETKGEYVRILVSADIVQKLLQNEIINYWNKFTFFEKAVIIDTSSKEG